MLKFKLSPLQLVSNWSISIYRHMLNDSDRLMALMILSLHGFLVSSPLTGNSLDAQEINYFHHALLLCQFGFFLLWQPLLRQTNALPWFISLAILFGVALIITFINWWVISFWVAGLFALIGGRVFSSESKHSRLPYILAASYLLAILLLWVVPKLLKADADLAAAEFLLIYFLPILPLIILFLSAKNKPNEQTPNIDFFYTLLIFLLTIIVILGSYAIGVVWQIHYIKLLIFAVLGLASTLVVLSWLWNPSATFSGLELLMSRYLLSLGLPFEQWIRKIATHAEKAESANRFLQEAMNELAALNWVSGMRWQVSDTAPQSMGAQTPYISTFTFQQLHLTLYSRWQFSPAMYLHVQLLTQILGEFYEAKRREETISQNTYTQALYETGSRLTHDIKNILQSLGALCLATEQPSNIEDDKRLITLVKNQLPRLNQRLAATLNKLEQPSLEKKRQAKVASWWKGFQNLNAHLLEAPHQVTFETPAKMPKIDIDIDIDVLDSVVDNLLQNALEKAKLETGINITVRLLPTEHFCLEVFDTGSAIPENIATRLFNTHVTSKNGLGVGLFHAAQQAKQAGYEICVYENRLSFVCFRVEKLE